MRKEMIIEVKQGFKQDITYCLDIYNSLLSVSFFGIIIFI